jgi:hypothetical protein
MGVTVKDENYFALAQAGRDKKREVLHRAAL